MVNKEVSVVLLSSQYTYIAYCTPFCFIPSLYLFSGYSQVLNYYTLLSGICRTHCQRNAISEILDVAFVNIYSTSPLYETTVLRKYLKNRSLPGQMFGTRYGFDWWRYCKHPSGSPGSISWRNNFLQGVNISGDIRSCRRVLVGPHRKINTVNCYYTPNSIKIVQQWIVALNVLGWIQWAWSSTSPGHF